MKICQKCGKELMEDAVICTGCGCAANSELATHGTSFVDTRQNNLIEAENMLQYFSQKNIQYAELDAVSLEVEELKNKTNLIWIILSAISVVIAIFTKSWIFYLLLVPFIAMFIFKRTKNKKMLNIASARQAELNDELHQHFLNYGYCPIGEEYVCPSTLSVLYDLMRKGRASTLGEAINICLADINAAEQLRLSQEAADAAKSAATAAKANAAITLFKK